MRPEKLFPLFSGVTRLKGVGEGAKAALSRLFGRGGDGVIVRDIAFHLPVSLIDRRSSPPLEMVQDGAIATYVVTVTAHHPPEKRGAKTPYKIICHTPSGFLTLVYFHARGEHLRQLLPEGQQRIVSGRIERFQQTAQMTHPDLVALPHELELIQVMEPVYPLTGGMTNRHLRKIVQSALALVPELPEWQDAAYVRDHGWSAWHTALRLAHHPESETDLSGLSCARMRLAYDEILASQLALAVTRARLKRPVAAPIVAPGALRAAAVASLPYRLTAGQERVISEIDADLASGLRMLRLLQGDVGSGKTIVALLAMLGVVECGRQAALMVPTELLGRQHLANLTRIAGPLGVTVELLTGSLKSREHAESLARIASGDAQIVIGTHALFQDKVIFHDLALAVIDEQHRFGVSQRMSLAAKNEGTHMLVMTATPIPRTLAMTAYGDMDSSTLDEKPVSRIPVTTRAVPLSRVEEVLQAVGRAMQGGGKVYWICPLVEENPDEELASDLAAAEARHIEFTHRFGPRVGLAHGRIPALERDETMRGFAGDQYDLLVATTVVEVGVDVPEATVIVIEHAERFGLAQLHQLRGRVGRGDKPSACLLLYADTAGEAAQSRLRVIRDSDDGFRIAEEDLKLRGSGDILGTRQSGLPDFHFADLALHGGLLRVAQSDARLILHNDPTLRTPRGEALRHLLYLFGYDENIRYLGAG